MREFNNIKIAVAGTGYVGMSIATLLAQHHFGRTSMNKNQIVNDRNQNTDFFPFLYTYLVLHRNKTAQVLFRKQPHSVSLSTISGTHSEPYFGLFFHFHYTIISEKDILPGLWTSYIRLKFNHLRVLYVIYGKLCTLLPRFLVVTHYLSGKKL